MVIVTSEIKLSIVTVGVKIINHWLIIIVTVITAIYGILPKSGYLVFVSWHLPFSGLFPASKHLQKILKSFLRLRGNMDYGELQMKAIVFDESLSFSFIIVVMTRMSWQFNISPSAFLSGLLSFEIK